MTGKSPSMDFDGVKRHFDEELAQARRELGTVNIAVFGNTGVGKSTLLNAVFGKELAATGAGDSVTDHIQYHGRDGEPLGIFDTPGFEIGGAEQTLLREITQLFAENAKRPITERIHVVWFVENSLGNRFVDAQARIVRHLASFGVPVMLILTRVRMTPQGTITRATNDLIDAIRARDLPTTPPGEVFCVNAVADDELGDPAHGLADLLDATFRAVPTDVHDALTAAQRLDMERKRRAAKAIINRFSLTSAAAGATPIPLADLALVTASVTRMFARISAVYGIPVRKRQLARLAAAVLVTGGAAGATSTAVTKAATKQVAKLTATKALAAGGRLVPVVNLIVAAAAGASAAAVAKSAGHAWARVCEHMLTKRIGEEIDAEALQVFTEDFARQRSKQSTSD